MLIQKPASAFGRKHPIFLDYLPCFNPPLLAFLRERLGAKQEPDFDENDAENQFVYLTEGLLVVEVMSIMFHFGQFNILIYNEEYECIGMISLGDLIYFLSMKDGIENMLCHKLKFNVKDARKALI